MTSARLKLKLSTDMVEKLILEQRSAGLTKLGNNPPKRNPWRDRGI